MSDIDLSPLSIRGRLLACADVPRFGEAIADPNPVVAFDGSGPVFANAAFARLVGAPSLAAALSGGTETAAAILAALIRLQEQSTGGLSDAAGVRIGDNEMVHLAAVEPLANAVRFTLKQDGGDGIDVACDQIAGFLKMLSPDGPAAYLPPAGTGAVPVIIGRGEPATALRALLDEGEPAQRPGPRTPDGWTAFPVGGLGGTLLLATDQRHPDCADRDGSAAADTALGRVGERHEPHRALVTETMPEKVERASAPRDTARRFSPVRAGRPSPLRGGSRPTADPAPHRLIETVRRAFVDHTPSAALATAPIEFVRAGPARADANHPPDRHPTILEFVDRSTVPLDGQLAAAGGASAECTEQEALLLTEGTDVSVAVPEHEALQAIARAFGARFEGDARQKEQVATSAETADERDRHAARILSVAGDPAAATAREIVGRIPMPLIVLRGERILQANPAACALLGHPSSAAIEAAGGLSEHLAGPTGAGTDGRRTMTIRAADGRYIEAIVRMVSIPYGAGHALLLALEVAKGAGSPDAPPRRQQDNRVEAVSPASPPTTDVSLAEFGSDDDARSEVTTMVARLRTSLAAIDGVATLIGRSDGIGDAELKARAAAEAIAAQLRTLWADVDAIEARLSGPTPGVAPQVAEVADLGEILRRLVADRRERARERDVVVSLGAPRSVPLARDQMGGVRRVAEVVLDRAIDRASGGRVWIDVSREADGVRLTVRDDGQGLPASDVARILSPLNPTTPDDEAAAAVDPLLMNAAALSRSCGLGFVVESTPSAGTTVAVVVDIADPIQDGC